MIATTVGPDDRGRFTPVIDLGDLGKIYGPKKFKTEDEAAHMAFSTMDVVKSEFIRRGWSTRP